MSQATRVQELVERALESGGSAEEICLEHPELLAAVRERLTWCARVDDELATLFPPSTAIGPPPLDALERWAANREQGLEGYAIGPELGRGGVGIVYQARHLALGRPIALKMLLAGEFATPCERARFDREARAIAALCHPNIVQVFDVGDHAGRAFYTMELIVGGTLAGRIAGRPRPVPEAAATIATLAGAVQAAHAAGFVHRDLKPGNVLLAADGTMKVSDFGLTRRHGGDEASLTLGFAIGTPAYMAPEQVAGTDDAGEPAVDIYALGVILYEMLTGEPPFRSGSAAETQRWVVERTPARPATINPRVPRDLETICLKCLEKAPRHRYVTAAALAEDLGRFIRGEPILARRTGLTERCVKWVRRRPAPAVAIATVALCGAMFAASAWRHAIDETARRAAVAADLDEMTRADAIGQWDAARGALQRAKARLEGGGATDLRRQVALAGEDLAFVAQLEAIRLSRVTSGGLIFYRQRADRDYEAAFARAGLIASGRPDPASATRMIASPVRRAIVEALDDWTASTADPARLARLLALASEVDARPPVADEPVRDAATWTDPKRLLALAKHVSVAAHSVSPLLALAERLKNAGENPVEPLLRVQQEHPADFWTNLTLGNALVLTSPADAGIYYRAALAARPSASVGYCAVGDSLRMQHRTDEAIDYYQKALGFDPNYARAEDNLGKAFRDAGRPEDAIACYERTLRLDPNYAWAHFDLGNVLTKQGRLEEARGHLAVIAAASPGSPEVQAAYRAVLLRLGLGAQVQTEWRQLLERDPRGFDAWSGYAELCLYQNDPPEYRRARAALLRHFGSVSDPRVAEPIARACLLMPLSGDELAQATALAERAEINNRVEPRAYYAYSLFGRGLADYRNGRFDAAIAAMTGEAATVLGPCPGLVAAMAFAEKGDLASARRSFDRAVGKFNWSPSRADRRDLWIYHILRREAEAKLAAAQAATP